MPASHVLEGVGLPVSCDARAVKVVVGDGDVLVLGAAEGQQPVVAWGVELFNFDVVDSFGMPCTYSATVCSQLPISVNTFLSATALETCDRNSPVMAVWENSQFVMRMSENEMKMEISL